MVLLTFFLLLTSPGQCQPGLEYPPCLQECAAEDNLVWTSLSDLWAEEAEKVLWLIDPEDETDLVERPVSEALEEPPFHEDTVIPPDDDRPYPRFTHNGQIQFQYDSPDLGSNRIGNFLPAGNGLAPFPAEGRGFVRRFRPTLRADFSPDVFFDSELNIDPQSGRILILDANLNFAVSENSLFRVGRFKVPFGWEGFRTSRAMETIERSDVTVFLYPERDMGVAWYYEKERTEFQMGAFLGQPRSNGDANGNLDIITRGVVPVNDQLKLGASGHLGTFRPTGTDSDIPVRRVGGELNYQNGPWTIDSEVMWSAGYNTASQAGTEAWGYFATAVYNLSDQWDLVASYDWFNPDIKAVDLSRPSNEANARDRKLVGVNYYISRDPIHRIMLNLETKQSLEGPYSNRAGLRLRYQISW